MLGRVVVEGEQCFLIGDDLLHRLRPLRRELGCERLDRILGVGLVLSPGDLADRGFRPGVDALWHRI